MQLVDRIAFRKFVEYANTSLHVSLVNSKNCLIEKPVIFSMPMMSYRGPSDGLTQVGVVICTHWGWTWEMKTPIENLPGMTLLTIQVTNESRWMPDYG